MLKQTMSVGCFFFIAALLLFASQSHADLDCVACHEPNGPHGEGFEGCNACHGYPPLTNVAGSDGLVEYPSSTGSVSPGAHAKHATASGYSYPCQTCHFGGMTAQGGIIQDPRQLEMGFNIFGNGGGVYNGRTLLAPYSYTAGHGTTININGSMTCSGIYCHSDGTSVSTNVIPAFLTPAWTSQDPLACNSCHGYPPAYEHDSPKANGHLRAGHARPCNECHYTTTNDGIHITDKTKHMNGVYDYAPDPSITGNLANYTDYIWDIGGGTCLGQCHLHEHSLTDTIGGISIGVNWGGRDYCNYRIVVSDPGVNCFEREFSLVAGDYNKCRLPGISYLWDFGDGQTSTEAEPRHTYAGPGNYTVTVAYRDANRHRGRALRGNSVVPPENIPPVTDMTISGDGSTIALTDLSYDPDYNTCGHSWGAGEIHIQWGQQYDQYATTTESLNLTDVPSNQVYYHTYPILGWPAERTITHRVRDARAGYIVSSSTGIILPVQANAFNISGRVTRLSDGAPVWNKGMDLKKNGVKYVSATTNPRGYYSFFLVAPGCYTVEPQAVSGYTFNPAMSALVCTGSTDVNFTITP